MEYDVVIKEMPSEHLASVRGVYPIARLPEVMGEEFRRILGALSAEGIEPSGGALAIYHGWTQETVDVEIAFTVRGVFFPQTPRSAVKPSRIAGGKVVFTTHVGPYDQIHNAYAAIEEYAQDNRLELADTMWERYLTDPAVEPDLRKHVTEVCWPLA
ncbi:MAG: GyrI-like domain-containing protein [Actinobacteria bacterium]|nr:GyrI-like domain-containing protein [Actinomycetota bacterium]